MSPKHKTFPSLALRLLSILLLTTTLVCQVSCGDETESVDTSVCASGTRWIGGDDGSPHMHPGRDCIACHTREGEGPRFTIAGTFYGASGQADDCFGASGAVIEVTDAAGKIVSLVSNPAGNFYTKDAVQFPITARVTFNGKTRQMSTPVSTGACNSCHTVQGAQGAPGRIAFP
ncbi:MAG: hypothetical protein RMJ98_10315 [Myxococcales bacterium]|nr:hypothetical protein [Polyangiaceae bacterium]MDW8249681.1 hypothetical protein [Myxococcales bacterium]